jgi:phosphoribosyl 1,2-cyclic phosphodiesterase
MLTHFWGVRGSIPTPAPDTIQFGGNTSCVSVDFGDSLVVFDAGTGLRLLGNAILDAKRRPRIHLFLSHVHWDHIQGFPFFAPAYKPDFQLDVYGHGAADHTLGRILAGQMEGPNFPVALDQLDAAISYRDIQPGKTVELSSAAGPFARMRCTRGNHPNGVLVYRLDSVASGKSLVYATDTEHRPDRMDADILDLARGADLFVYDGMYTPEEYGSHKGWGHSTWEKGFELAHAAGVKTYVVFHHDPSHNDAFLVALEEKVQRHCRGLVPGIQVLFAREGMEIGLS